MANPVAYSADPGIIAQVKVYFDNVIVCGLVLRDVMKNNPDRPDEMKAIDALLSAFQRNEVDLYSSAESFREQERTRNVETRARLLSNRGRLPGVKRDHDVLGFSRLTDHIGTCICSPLVSDVVDTALHAQLRSAGIEDCDAKHIVNAVVNGCARFVTTDTKDIHPKRTEIERLCPQLKVVWPTDLARELGLPL